MIQGRSGADWEVSPLPALHGYQVEWAEPGELLVSRRNRLFRTDADGAARSHVGTFPAPRWKATAARFRPVQRLFRFLFYNVLKLEDGRLFAAFDKSIGLLDGDRFLPIRGLVRPCRILRSACALSDDGNVYFGEYVGNGERGPIRIYRYVPGSPGVEVVHEFPSGGVRHVHGIYRDPYTRALWCVTGDVGEECRILRTHDGFRTVDTIGAGDESWRSVCLAFTESAVYYATDAQFIRNVVYRMDRASLDRDVLGEIDGPVYVCTSLGDDLFFAVTAELCPSQVGRSATLWHVGTSGKLEPIVSFPKDRLPVDYFMMGTIHVPRGPGLPDRLLLNGLGLRGADDRTFELRRAAVGGAARG